MPQSVISEQTTQIPETLAKQGISGQNKENQNYDKNTIHLPRQYLEKASKINDFMKHLGAYYTTTKPFEFRSEP